MPLKSKGRRPTRKARSCGAPRAGQKCPHCRSARLGYNGLVQLACPACGYVAEGGGFT